MKLNNIFVIATLMASTSFFTTPVHAEEYDMRIRIQGQSTNPGFGLSGVLELPSLSSPDIVLMGVGPSHTSKKINVALHFSGMLLPNNKATSIVDFRGAINFNDHVFSWVNLHLRGFERFEKTSAYGFATVNYKLPFSYSKISIGVESENRILMSRNPGTSDYSIGPNMMFQITPKSRIEVAYQFHSRMNDQAWARAHILF